MCKVLKEKNLFLFILKEEQNIESKFKIYVMTIVVEEGTITREDHHGELVKTPQCLCSWSTGIARYIYALIFLTTNLLAWMVRDYGRVALSKLLSMQFILSSSSLSTVLFVFVFSLIENLEMQGFQSGKECLGSEGVLRISLGCFVSFKK